MLLEILNALFLLLAALFAAYLIRHYVFTLTVLKDYGKTKKPAMSDNAADPFSVSMLIPACDEERVIWRILQRITEMTYPKDKLTAIVIDDASRDRTGEIAESYSRSHDFIKVVHRDRNEGRRGKASALNAGLQHAQGEIIICFDADYYPQRDILEHLTKEFADPAVGAVQGRVTVLNEPKNIVTRLVALERIGGYRVDQQARDAMGLITQFGGTQGSWRCLPQTEPLVLISLSST